MEHCAEIDVSLEQSSDHAGQPASARRLEAGRARPDAGPSQRPARRVRHWVEAARRWTVEEHYADLELRTEVFDAVQRVLGHYDLLVCPTLSCTAVLNRDDGDTKGPAEVAGELVDPLIGWCPTYLFNFTGHPAASVPCG